MEKMEEQKKFPKWWAVVAFLVIAVLVTRGGNTGGLRGRFVREQTLGGTTAEQSLEFTRNRFVWTRLHPVLRRSLSSFPVFGDDSPAKAGSELLASSVTINNGVFDIFRVACRGTFSITGEIIELICNDDECSMLLLPFSRTENTVSIGGQRFVRE